MWAVRASIPVSGGVVAKGTLSDLRKVAILFFLLTALLVPAGARAASDAPDLILAKMGIVTGKVMLDNGSPMTGGKAVFFREGTGQPPHPTRYLRPPDEVFEIGKAGEFKAVLPEGRYYFSATLKKTGDLIGPPAEGDYLYPGYLEMPKGVTVFTVSAGETKDLGTITAFPFTKGAITMDKDLTAIGGTVRDANGRPMAGAMVFAYRAADLVGKPLFVSERTGENGQYLLGVGEGGTYYLKTRNFHVTMLDKGGYPEADENVGIFGQDRPQPVTVKTGEVAGGIDITSKPFADYPPRMPAAGPGKKSPPRQDRSHAGADEKILQLVPVVPQNPAQSGRP